MQTKEITLNEIVYVITRLNAHDSSFLAIQFLPILASLQSALGAQKDATALAGVLAGLTKEKYDEIVFALFCRIKRREHNALFNIFDNGVIVYEDIKSDPFLYLSLLKESFMLSFGDFLVSAARAFPSVATALKDPSNTPA